MPLNNQVDEKYVPLKVCYFGTYRKNYSRNQIMVEGLRRAGVEVIECHENLWRDIQDRVEIARGGWLNPRFWWRLIKAYLNLLLKYRQIQEYEVMVVGYPGQLDVFIARLLTWIKHKPLVWDVFMSIYLIAKERGLDHKNHNSVKLIRMIESFSIRLPDLLIHDTQVYAEWFQSNYNLHLHRYCLIPTGADDRVFRRSTIIMIGSEPFKVVYYGTFIPNHGVLYIVEAAKLLADNKSIQFEFIGEGPERAKAEKLAYQYGLPNINFLPWMEKEEIIDHLLNADICLGAFGKTPQSLMTVQNKIYEGLAMGIPVITGDSLAVRQHLTHEKNIIVCDRDNPLSLADAIKTLQLKTDFRNMIGSDGARIYYERYAIDKVGSRFKDCILKLVNR
jgi:glycosyltransferase involved in cell wall biosynthesis